MEDHAVHGAPRVAAAICNAGRIVPLAPRVARRPARERNVNGGQAKPALARLDLGHVAPPQDVRSDRVEAAARQVMGRLPLAGPGQALAAARGLAALETEPGHDLRDGVHRDLPALGPTDPA